MTIRTKLVVVFAVIALGMTGFGLFTLQQVRALHQATVAVSNKLVQVGELGDLDADLERSQALFGLATVAPDPVDRNAIVGENSDVRVKMEAVWAKYRRAETAPGVVAASRRTEEAWKRFDATGAQIVDLAQTGFIDQGQTILLGRFRKAAVAFRDALEANIALEARQMATVNRHSSVLAARTSAFVLAACAVTLVLCVLLGASLIRGIADPVKRMALAMRRLAAHDLDIDILGLGRTDEVGDMADALGIFRESLLATDRLDAEQKAAQRAKEARAAHLDVLVQRFERQVGEMTSVLAAAATELEATAKGMSGSAQRTNQQAGEVASAAETAGIGVQTVASAAEELSASIGEIARQIGQSASMTTEAVGKARDTNTTVQALADSAQRIGAVIGLISDIAAQTNLLALNATIEAARAGDAGRGFAVVASEVKNLASQTAKATDEIGSQIRDVQAATRQAVDSIGTIVRLVEDLGGIATAIAASVEEQGAATAEIARNAQQTAEATGTVTVNIGGVSAAANDTGGAAHQVLSSAADLSRQAESLTTEVASFVQDVRAA